MYADTIFLLQMNYAQALKGPRTKSYMLNVLHSQAETEIGHKLSKEEVSQLCQRFTIENVYGTVNKVKCIYSM